MNTPTIPKAHKRRLQAHFGLSGLPFRKNVSAGQMFDSAAQRQLLQGLALWLEIRGLALVTGPSGAGKSITLRRFVSELPSDRYTVFRFGQIPTTPAGFLRALCRRLELRPRAWVSDMFDAARDCLAGWQERHGTHPVVVMDDAEGMRADTLDLVRRLTAGELDAEDRFSVLLVATERLLITLAEPNLAPLRTRFGYVQALRPFSIEDTRNYVAFHLEHASADPAIFSDDATTALFSVTEGVPRAINQLALQALIQVVVEGRDKVDGRMMKRVIHHHPLYAAGRVK